MCHTDYLSTLNFVSFFKNMIRKIIFATTKYHRRSSHKQQQAIIIFFACLITTVIQLWRYIASINLFFINNRLLKHNL